MIVFATLIFLIIFFFFACKVFLQKERKKIYCILMFIATTLVLGLRHPMVGGIDTYISYVPAFEAICNLSMRDVFLKHQLKDPMFYICSKLISYVTHNSQVYLLILAAITMGLFSMWAYKHSKNPALSYILYLALGFYARGFQQLRMMIALSILLFAFKYLQSGKKLPFLLIVLLASLFHTTSLIFLLAYPISSMKINAKQIIIIVATTVAGLTLGKKIIVLIVNLLSSGDDRWSGYITSETSSLSLAGVAVLLVVYVFSLFLVIMSGKISLLQTYPYKIYFNMSVLAICFMGWVPILGEFQRISMFFGIYNVLLIPEAISLVPDNRERKIWTIIVSLVMIFYFMVFGLENSQLDIYKFFWN